MKIVRFLLAVALGGFIGVVIGLFVPRNNPYVHVLVTNSASSPVQTARLESEDGEIYLIENLSVGESKPVRVYASGESSYILKVVFANGKTLQGGAGYVESGYKISEKITDTKIETDHDFTGVY